MDKRAGIRAWLSSLVKRSDFNTRWIPLKQSTDWSYQDGMIRHRSNRFFSIIGIAWSDYLGNQVEQPLIDQREIGTLGFIIKRDGKHNQLLVQAKIEPGNVGIAQLAPTCQATASNTDKVHGGKTPYFSDWFASNQSAVLSSSLQSEQGTRFFCKQNRNILINTDTKVDHDQYHQWIDTDRLLDLIDQDFLINTDARSVLIASPWKQLSTRQPFTRYQHRLGVELATSYLSRREYVATGQVKETVYNYRKASLRPEIVNLGELSGWTITQAGVSPKNGGPFSIKQIQVNAKGREVSAWDQPIIDSRGTGEIVLLCGRINNLLHILFQVQIEPGLHNLVELGPTICRVPGQEIDSIDLVKLPQGKVIIHTRQSDEGGRFYQDICHYSIIDIGEATQFKQGFWLTLNQIQTLLLEGDWFTNEARSALTLLLKWL